MVEEFLNENAFHSSSQCSSNELGSSVWTGKQEVCVLMTNMQTKVQGDKFKCKPRRWECQAISDYHGFLLGPTNENKHEWFWKNATWTDKSRRFSLTFLFKRVSVFQW